MSIICPSPGCAARRTPLRGLVDRTKVHFGKEVHVALSRARDSPPAAN